MDVRVAGGVAHARRQPLKRTELSLFVFTLCLCVRTKDKAIKFVVLKAPVVAAARRPWARQMLPKHARQPVRPAANLLRRVREY